MHTLPRVEDNPLPLSEIAKNGYYQVGTKIYSHKILALQEATRTGLSVRWNFNNEAFGAFNWRTSSGVGLRELYRLRAVQLRNKYKYIILAWSGGGDSTTMIQSFCDNNIPVDEVVISWPVSLQDGNYTPSSKDISATNMPSEWEFSVKPMMDRLKKQYPTLKITIADNQLNKNEYADDTVLIAEKHSYMSIQRWRALDRVIQDRTEKYHDVVCVYGVSPVDISLLDDWVAVNFCDSNLAAGVVTDITLQGWKRQVEFFYWSPDMPEIPREQAHILLQELNANPKLKQLIPQYSMKKTGTADISLKKVYYPGDDKSILIEVLHQVSEYGDGDWQHEMSRRWKKSLFYRDYPLDNFQVIKQSDTHSRNGTWESFLAKNPHADEYYNPWESAVRAHQALIDPKFFIMKNGQISSYTKYFTPWYPIGRLKTESIRL